MSVLSRAKYTSHFPELGSRVIPTAFPKAKWLILSPEVEALLDRIGKKDLPLFAGLKTLDDTLPFAQKYTGHQFGHYNPDLGDGRGLLLGESNDWELHVKGAGQTPYSRFGDGRAVLRSCVREFLASEALHHLGIPTSRALGVFTTGEQVHREELEPGAAMVRVCRSHLRFGHFEYAYHQGDTDLLERLVGHCLTDLEMAEPTGEIEEDARLMFSEIIKRTAKMIAKWQAFGFCHGVMNTDNMSVLGITFDFGPYGFLDQYNPRHICNHSDHSGRYAFDEQPGVALWNLKVLGHTLSPLLSEQTIRECLQKYQTILLAEYSTLMRRKLGLSDRRNDDDKLLASLLSLMEQNQADYTITWRKLSKALDEPQFWIDLFVDRDAAKTWLEQYRKRCAMDAYSSDERQAYMDAINPKYVLRNHLAQQAIEAAEAGDTAPLENLFEVLKKPFADQTDQEALAKHPPEWAKSLDISCSS